MMSEITAGDVLSMLIPEGGWATTSQNYEDIQFLECDPITKEQFEAGFAKCATYKLQQETKKATAKSALLDKLGITADEAALLLQ